MAILQSNSGTHPAGTTTFSVTVSSTTAATSQVVIGVFGNTTVTTPAGFTSRAPQVNVAGHYLFDAPGGASSWSVTASPAGQVTWHVYVIANGAHDTSSGQNTTGGSSYSTTTITPAAGERELLAFIGNVEESGVTTASAWTNSFVEGFDTVTGTGSEYNSFASATRNVTANGSTGYSTGATLSQTASQARSAIIAAYSTSAASIAIPGRPQAYVPRRRAANW